MYDNGYYIARNKEISDAYFKIALDQLKISIKNGDYEACCDLGYMYDCGCFVTKNEKKAFKYYKISADNGLQRAQFNLGLLYDQGVGVAMDIQMSLHYFKCAADQGYVNALCHLGYLHRIGFPMGNIPIDHPKAFKLYKQAADSGYYQAIIDVGNFYMRGMGVPKDYKSAIKYYMKIGPRNDEARRCIIKLLQSTNENQNIVAKSYFSEEWPDTHKYLHSRCQMALLELYNIGPQLGILPELIIMISRIIIILWPEKDAHYDEYAEVKYRENLII